MINKNKITKIHGYILLTILMNISMYYSITTAGIGFTLVKLGIMCGLSLLITFAWYLILPHNKNDEVDD